MKKIEVNKTKHAYAIAIVEPGGDGNYEIVDYCCIEHSFDPRSKGERRLARYLANSDKKECEKSGMHAIVVEREYIEKVIVRY